MYEPQFQTVDSAVEWYRQQLRKENVSVATRRTYIFLVRQFLNFAAQRDSAWQHSPQEKLQDVLREFLMTTSTGTVNTRLSAINHFLATIKFPCSRTPPGQVLNAEELSRFLSVARQEEVTNRSIAFLLATTGIQLSAAVRLNRACFEYTESTLFMNVRVSGVSRQVPLNQETQFVVEELFSQRQFSSAEHKSVETGSSIWVDENGRSLSLRDLTLRVKSMGWTANLFVTPIILRRTRLIQLVKSCDSAATLAYLGLFDDIQSAQRILRSSRSGTIFSRPFKNEFEPLS